MTNFLLQFNSEQDAQNVLPLYYSDNGWDTSRCIPNVQVWKLDEQGNRTDIEGWFIRIGDENAILEPMSMDETNLNTSPVFAGDDVQVVVAPVGDKTELIPIPSYTEPVDTREPIIDQPDAVA